MTYVKKDLEELKGFSEAEKHIQNEKYLAEIVKLTADRATIVKKFSETIVLGLILDTTTIITLILVAAFTVYGKEALILIAMVITLIKHGALILTAAKK